MSEIGIKEQCFGVEVEMTGITREQAAKALAQYFDKTASHIDGPHDVWEILDKENKVWRLRDTDNIAAQRNHDGGYIQTSDLQYRIELLTPKLEYNELAKLNGCLNALRLSGCHINGTCGLHILIDSENHNRQSIKNLIGIMFSKEDMIFKALGISEERAARWCRKVREPMLERARKLSSDETKDLTKLEAIWFNSGINSDDAATEYYALDLNSAFYHGMIKFRCFNATFQPKRIKAYLDLCLAVSSQAIRQRSTVKQKTETENEKFTFRVWLVRLGLNGDEYKTTRDVLLEKLEGDMAYRYGKDKHREKKTQRSQAR